VPRIRTSSPVIARLIHDATERSPTFHQMVDTISATDGVVYVEQGTCGHGVRACLVLTVTIAGPSRMLRVLVDPHKADSDLQGAIGHELRHAIEVLSIPTVRSDGALYHLYERGSSFQDHPFETIAAIQAGEIVRTELNARPPLRRQVFQRPPIPAVSRLGPAATTRTLGIRRTVRLTTTVSAVVVTPINVCASCSCGVVPAASQWSDSWLLRSSDSAYCPSSLCCC